MSRVKIQEKYNLGGRECIFFGVYPLYCPEHLLVPNSELYRIAKGPSSGKIQAVKKYLDFLDLPPKYKTRRWIGLKFQEPRKYGKIKKKSTSLGRYFDRYKYHMSMYYKNEYNSCIRRNLMISRTYSKLLDKFLKNFIIPRYIKTLELESSYVSYGDVYMYISLYMSKKFGWI